MSPAAEASRIPRHGVARVISKSGLCSRSEAERRVREGRVQINGRIIRDPESPVRAGLDHVSVDGEILRPRAPVHLMLNKPRGLLTTTSDEKSRATVYQCLDGAGLPWLAPVGRLDRASEGLLLFSNDPEWAAQWTDPDKNVNKRYRVQVRGRIPGDIAERCNKGIDSGGETLSAVSVEVLRQSDRTAWLEIVLDEGRNRQIRRMLTELDLEVLRLIRVAIGGLQLGDLAKGQWRLLGADDLRALSRQD